MQKEVFFFPVGALHRLLAKGSRALINILISFISACPNRPPPTVFFIESHLKCILVYRRAPVIFHLASTGRARWHFGRIWALGKCLLFPGSSYRQEKTLAHLPSWSQLNNAYRCFWRYQHANYQQEVDAGKLPLSGEFFFSQPKSNTSQVCLFCK